MMMFAVHTAKYILLTGLLLCTAKMPYAQDSLVKEPTVTTRFFVDAYYTYDFSKPANKLKAPFLYNHNRHNQVAVNLVLASVQYKQQSVRAAVALMAGTYSRYNLASEPALLRHVYEANAGVRLFKQQDVWLDAGILPSHIGFESAISKDCQTLSRSMLAENSPYYETGARVSYTSKNKKWYAAALLLNGWQRIVPVARNRSISLGTQITWSPSNRFSLNWSSFAGNTKPDSIRQQRYFQNIYARWAPVSQWQFIAGLDFGFEQISRYVNRYQSWLAPILQISYHKQPCAFAARAEYFNDPAGVIMPRIEQQAFRMYGYSANIDRNLGSWGVYRMEWRMFQHYTPYFLYSNQRKKMNHMFTCSFLFDLKR